MYILLTKLTATQNEAALSYHRECGLYLMAVIFGSITVMFGYEIYENYLTIPWKNPDEQEAVNAFPFF